MLPKFNLKNQKQKTQILSAIIILLLSTIPLHASAVPDELIIKVKTGHKLPDLGSKAIIQNLFETVYVIRNIDATKLAAILKNHPDLVYTEKNHRAEKHPRTLPSQRIEKRPRILSTSFFNDPKIDQLWSFDPAEYFGVSIEAAYKLFAKPTSATQTVIVAVVDTGVDNTHQDLKDIMWVNSQEVPENNIDDDGNGYIDDIYGINVLIRNSSGQATSNTMDADFHGTHVAGTIAAKQNNGIGIAGIASNVRIMAIRAIPNDNDESDVDVAEAFIYAAKNGAKIINCSFGKNNNEGKNLIPDTLKYIQDNYGVLVIAAAGNSSLDIDKVPTYPASYNNENLLVVANSTSSGLMSVFSNYGKINVDLAAPGSGIYSTIPGNKYESLSGTSMASPTATGVAAEVLSHFPHLSYRELKFVLMNSVSKVERYKEKVASGGRIDLLKALELARTLK